MTASWAEQYVGLPYRARGRDRQGIDCWGLVRLVLREQFGTDVPEYAGHYWTRELTPAVAEKIAEESARWEAVPAGMERAGDVVLLRLRGYPIHVGIVVAPGEMLHAHDGADAARESYHALHWRHRVVGFYRHA